MLRDVYLERNSSDSQQHLEENFTEYFVRTILDLDVRKNSFVLVSDGREKNGGLRLAKVLLLLEYVFVGAMEKKNMLFSVLGRHV